MRSLVDEILQGKAAVLYAAGDRLCILASKSDIATAQEFIRANEGRLEPVVTIRGALEDSTE